VNVLIVGGSGHVSGALARAALAAGHAVWTITRGRRPTPPGVCALYADRGDFDAFARVVTNAGTTWDLVVDCICYDVPDIEHDLDLFPSRAGHFVLVSTDFVYDPERRAFPQPAEARHYVAGGEGALAYGLRKRNCERVLMATDTGAMAWTIVRPCHIYGPPSRLGCLPLHGRDPELIDTLRAGKPLRLVGAGHFLQQPITADDLAGLLLGIAGNAKAAGRVFNAAGPEIVEAREYYRLIAEVLGVGLAVDEAPVAAYRARHPGRAPFLCHRIYDLAPLAEAGLHVPSTSLARGLRAHVEALLAQRPGNTPGR
jgi:nucleoside-diphosphate-sugar epimerase